MRRIAAIALVVFVAAGCAAEPRSTAVEEAATAAMESKRAGLLHFGKRDSSHVPVDDEELEEASVRTGVLLEDDGDHDGEEGSLSSDKRAGLLHFGKKRAGLLHFGKKRAGLLHFGKRAGLLHFGKRAGLLHFGKKRAGLLHFGKRPQDEIYDEAMPPELYDEDNYDDESDD